MSNASAASSGKWSPATEPFRVLHTRKSSQYGCYGWAHDKPRTFATMAEAEAYAATLTPSITVTIDEAQNAETWPRNGRWKRLKTIKPVKS